jgi:ADP-L-glycero-D-manno-heptose 6-epimerase
MKEQIVITGAAGMIGSGVVRYLNDLGYKNLILVDDLKESEKWKNLVGKQFNHWISKTTLFQWLEGKESEIDAIIHLGACSDTMETNGDYLLENNYRFSIRLAQWALERNKRFIYASSAATYGDGSKGFIDDESQLEVLSPINMYGFSKHMVDLWMKQQNVLDRVVGLKYFNVFGPNEYHKGRMASMILKMAHIAKNEGVIRLYQSNDLARFAHGEQKRDFIYVKEAVQKSVFFLTSLACGIYNIGSGCPTSWNQMASYLFGALGKKVEIRYIEMPKELDKQYQNFTCADMKKSSSLFSQLPKISMEEAVREYVQDYLLVNARW